MSAVVAFIGCGDEKVRVDLIESYRDNGVDPWGKESVEVNALSGRTYEYAGSLSSFEDLLRQVVLASS